MQSKTNPLPSAGTHREPFKENKSGNRSEGRSSTVMNCGPWKVSLPPQCRHAWAMGTPPLLEGLQASLSASKSPNFGAGCDGLTHAPR